MKNELKTVFFGTDDFATAVLDELVKAGFEPVLIVTAPDAPRGRKLVLTSPPVRRWADERGTDVFQPKSLKDPEFLHELKNTDWDLFIVASYGRLIPQDILGIPQRGTLNVHPSLLPKFRGASPVQSAILADEMKTGVTIMLVDEKMDHGPIVAQSSVTLSDALNAEDGGWPPKASTLSALLAKEGGELLAEVIPEWIRGNITPEPQDEAQATHSRKITKEDGQVNLAGDPYQNFLKIQALSENPGAYFFTERNGKTIRVKITDAQYENGALTITRVIPEGKREMAYEDFVKNN